MQISESGVFAGLAILTILGIILIIVICFINLAVGLQTLAFFIAIWSFFFGLVYAGLFAYNAAMGNTNASPSNAPDATSSLTPLSDDFMNALDAQLKSQDPAGIEPPFQGDMM